MSSSRTNDDVKGATNERTANSSEGLETCSSNNGRSQGNPGSPGARPLSQTGTGTGSNVATVQICVQVIAVDVTTVLANTPPAQVQLPAGHDASQGVTEQICVPSEEEAVSVEEAAAPAEQKDGSGSGFGLTSTPTGAAVGGKKRKTVGETSKEPLKKSRHLCNVPTCTHKKATEEGYANKEDLGKHVQTKHTDKGRGGHSCSVCHKKYVHKNGLNKHMWSKHNGEGVKEDFKFQCSTCKARYRTKKERDEHEQEQACTLICDNNVPVYNRGVESGAENQYLPDTAGLNFDNNVPVNNRGVESDAANQTDFDVNAVNQDFDLDEYMNDVFGD